MEPVEHVASLRLAGSTASDVDRPLGSAPLNQRNVHPHAIDVFIVPLAASALSVKTLLRSTLELLVTVLDGIFPIVMQGARLPLFLARIIGDVVAVMLRSLVWLLPLSAQRQKELREILARQWSQIRKHISYRAFEAALHQALTRHGMGVSDLPASHATYRSVRHLLRRVVVSSNLRHIDGASRLSALACNHLATLDAALPHPGRHDGEKQNPGLARLSCRLAAGEAASHCDGNFAPLS
jgi:hypothetical protein